MKRRRDLVSARCSQGEIPARQPPAQKAPRPLPQARAVELPDMATIDARIRYEDEDTGERRVVRLVYPEDAVGRSDRVSVLDPLGMALLGLREGECVDWPLPNGKRQRIRMMSVLSRRPLPKRDG